MKYSKLIATIFLLSFFGKYASAGEFEETGLFIEKWLKSHSLQCERDFKFKDGKPIKDQAPILEYYPLHKDGSIEITDAYKSKNNSITVFVRVKDIENPNRPHRTVMDVLGSVKDKDGFNGRRYKITLKRALDSFSVKSIYVGKFTDVKREDGEKQNNWKCSI